MPTGKKRIRRKPEDARALILDAAEKSMAAHGPAGIRLQDVAQQAGVSHPTILHHFGSREGLVRALNQRTLEDLKGALIADPNNFFLTMFEPCEGCAPRTPPATR